MDILIKIYLNGISFFAVTLEERTQCVKPAKENQAFFILSEAAHTFHTPEKCHTQNATHIFSPSRYTTISNTSEEMIILTFRAALEREHRGPARICWQTQQIDADFQRLPVPHTNAGGRCQPPWCTPGLVVCLWLCWETLPKSKCKAETNFCPLPSVAGGHCSCVWNEDENESLFQVLTACPGRVGGFLSGPADLYWSSSDGVMLDSQEVFLLYFVLTWKGLEPQKNPVCKIWQIQPGKRCSSAAPARLQRKATTIDRFEHTISNLHIDLCSPSCHHGKT